MPQMDENGNFVPGANPPAPTAESDDPANAMQTPWTQNIDAAGFNLTNLGSGSATETVTFADGKISLNSDGSATFANGILVLAQDGSVNVGGGAEIVLNPDGGMTAGDGAVSITAGTGGVPVISMTGDLEVTVIGKGVILKSPDGTRYRLKVANGGALSTEVVV